MCVGSYAFVAYLCAFLGATLGSEGVEQDFSGTTVRSKQGVSAYEVQVIRDVVYRDLHDGEDEKKRKNKLDIYVPRGKENFPVLFFVHGGAWIHGDKNFFGVYSNLGMKWARHGVGTVVVNYRLSPGVRHPAHIQDVAKAFAWTHKHIGTYGGRRDSIFVCGHSAGGHLISLLSADEAHLKAEGLNRDAVRGAIPISGVFRIHDLNLNLGVNGPDGRDAALTTPMRIKSPPFDSVFGPDRAGRKAASPLTHVKPGLPPFLIIYADRDLPTLADMAAEFSVALRDQKCAAQTFEVKNRNHFSVLLNLAQDDDPASQAISQFINSRTTKVRAAGGD